MTKVTQIVPETVQKIEDEFGTSFVVTDRFGVVPEIELFFADGAFMIRQENKDTVDILGLTIGQTNDILMAISLALDIPVRVL